MASPFTDLNQDEWVQILLQNSNVQTGGSLIGFRGTPFQRGYGIGSIFRALFKIAAPITKSIVKNVAKEGLSSAVGVGTDLLEGKNFEDSIKSRSKTAGKRLLKRGIKSAKKKMQKGSGNVGYISKKLIKRKKTNIGYERKVARKPRATKKKDYLDLN